LGFCVTAALKAKRLAMDIATIIGLALGVFLLALIAFPERFIPDQIIKYKRVGSTYWGAYPDENPIEPEESKTFMVKTVKTKEQVVGGSTTYAAGRGISFRGG
jgi:hypothetical protein